MSNKGFDKITDVDRFIRKVWPESGMCSGVRVRIEKIEGFELFNTRPYHNYENWSDGYRVIIYNPENKEEILKVEYEDLDDALTRAAMLYLCPKCINVDDSEERNTKVGCAYGREKGIKPIEIKRPGCISHTEEGCHFMYQHWDKSLQICEFYKEKKINET